MRGVSRHGEKIKDLQVYVKKKRKDLPSHVPYQEASWDTLEQGFSLFSSHPRDFFDGSSISITFRKGVCYCIKHHLFDFVLYSALFLSFCFFVLALFSIFRGILSTYVKQWKAAIEKEMKTLEKNHTYEMVDLLKGKELGGWKCISYETLV